MDISATTEPRSDQQNFDDYAAAPKTVTISEVRAGNAEQPVEIHLVEYPGRPYKPSKSMRRVLVAAWGSEAAVYAGRKMTLYGDPTVKFGGIALGGIKIGALSNISERLTISLTVTKGKRADHTVDPLPDITPTEAATAVLESLDIEGLKALWRTSDPGTRKAIEARVAELDKQRAAQTGASSEAGS